MFSVPSVPVAAIVVFLVRQGRSDIDMSLSLPFIRCPSIVDNGYKPVPVVPDVKDHVAVHRMASLNMPRTPSKLCQRTALTMAVQALISFAASDSLIQCSRKAVMKSIILSSRCNPASRRRSEPNRPAGSEPAIWGG